MTPLSRRVLGLTACGFLLALGVQTVGAATPTPSAVGLASVSGIVVSPLYPQTGTVVAVASDAGCHSSCVHLWATHDGGHAWAKTRGAGWSGQLPVIGARADGTEVMVASGSNGVIQSADGGNSWSVIGPVGTPSLSSAYSTDQTVAVASAPDYLLRGTARQAVPGSGGTLNDLSFALSPAFPAGGQNPPALLSGSDKNTNSAVVAQCNAQLSCSRVAALPGAVPYYSVPAALLMSSDFANDGTVFAQTGRGLFKSTNGGASFAPLSVAGTSSNTATTAMALAAGYREAGPVRSMVASVFQVHTDPQHPYSSGGIYRSVDGGATWSADPGPAYLTQGASAVALAPDGRVFAGYFGSGGTEGLVCSTDQTNWSASCPATVTRPSSAANTITQGATRPPGDTAQASGGSAGATPSPADAQIAGLTAGTAHTAGTAGHLASAAHNELPVPLPVAAGIALIALAIGVFIVRRRSQRGRLTEEGMEGTSK